MTDTPDRVALYSHGRDIIARRGALSPAVAAGLERTLRNWLRSPQAPLHASRDGLNVVTGFVHGLLACHEPNDVADTLMDRVSRSNAASSRSRATSPRPQVEGIGDGAAREPGPGDRQSGSDR